MQQVIFLIQRSGLWVAEYNTMSFNSYRQTVFSSFDIKRMMKTFSFIQQFQTPKNSKMNVFMFNLDITYFLWPNFLFAE